MKLMLTAIYLSVVSIFLWMVADYGNYQEFLSVTFLPFGISILLFLIGVFKK